MELALGNYLKMGMKKTFEVNEYLVPIYRFIVLLFIYALLRISFYLFNISLFPNVTPSGMMEIMAGGIRFDISALIYINILYWLLYVLAFRAKTNKVYTKIVDGVYYVLNAFCIGSNCCDFIYYKFILKRTTFNVLDSLKNEDLFDLFGLFIIDYWYVLLYFIVAIAMLVYLTRMVKPRLTPIKNTFAYAAVGIVYLALIGLLSVGGIRGGFRHSTRPITLSNAAAYTSSPEESAIVLNTPFSIIRTIGKKSFVKYEFFSEEELERHFTPVHHAAETQNGMEKKNVVIFILESFSREFFGSLNEKLENGEYRGYTPFLDSLINNSLVFTNAYANGRKSIDAMPSVLASIPSLTMPYIVSEYSNNHINSVASLLNKKGYKTVFFHGAPNGSMGFDAFANTAGFSEYRGKNEYGNDEDFDGIWGIWDHKFFQYYANEIGKLSKPFCTALFSLSSHHPFKVPQEYEGKFPKGNIPLQQCIGYTDNALRMFFDNARKQEWYDNTLFVITADHSIGGDHEEYKNNAQAFAVPIIFYCPTDTTLKGRDNSIAQQADIMPSILGYLGYDEDFISFGNNLFDKENADKRFAINYHNEMYQIYMNDTIAYFDGKQIVGEFDMKADPSLEHNIAEGTNSQVILDKVKAYVQQYNNRMINDNLTIKAQ